MKKPKLVILISILTLLFAIQFFPFAPHLSAQSCLPDGITFSTQEQIDNFQINYPGCTEIEGGVIIEGDGITNLDGLNVINSIGAYL